MEFQKVPTRTVNLSERIESEMPEDIPLTGDEGYTLKDVADGKIDIDKFIGQLSDDDLMCLMRGEGNVQYESDARNCCRIWRTYSFT